MQAIIEHAVASAVGVAIKGPGSYVLHIEHNGNPHCVALIVGDGLAELQVLDGAVCVSTSRAKFLNCASASIHKSRLVGFKTCTSPSQAPPGNALLDDDAFMLLDMQAGG